MKTKLSVLLERLRDNGSLPKELLQNTTGIERCILFHESLNKIEPFLYIRWNSQRKILSTYQKINRPSYILICRNTTPNRKPDDPLVYEWEVIHIKRLKDNTYDYYTLDADEELIENFKDARNIIFEEDGEEKKIFLSGFMARWFMPLPITNEQEAQDAVFPVRRIFKFGSMYEIKIERMYNKLLDAGIKEADIDHKIFMTSPFEQISLHPNSYISLKNLQDFSEDLFFFNKSGYPTFNSEKCIFIKKLYDDPDNSADIKCNQWQVYGAILEKKNGREEIKSLERIKIDEKEVTYPLIYEENPHDENCIWKINQNIDPTISPEETYSVGLEGLDKYGGILVLLKHHKMHGKHAFRNNQQYTAYLFTNILKNTPEKETTEE